LAFQTLDTTLSSNDLGILEGLGYEKKYNNNLMQHYAPGDNDSTQYKSAHAAWANAQANIAMLLKTIGVNGSKFVSQTAGTLNASITSYTSSTSLSQFQSDQSSIMGVTNVFPPPSKVASPVVSVAPSVGVAAGMNIQIFIQYIYYIMTNTTNSPGNPNSWQGSASIGDGLVVLSTMLQKAIANGAKFTTNSTTGINIYDAYITIMSSEFTSFINNYTNIGPQLTSLLTVANLYSPS
jgi:hypothetical protein